MSNTRSRAWAGKTSVRYHKSTVVELTQYTACSVKWLMVLLPMKHSLLTALCHPLIVIVKMNLAPTVGALHRCLGTAGRYGWSRRSAQSQCPRCKSGLALSSTTSARFLVVGATVKPLLSISMRLCCQRHSLCRDAPWPRSRRGPGFDRTTCNVSRDLPVCCSPRRFSHTDQNTLWSLQALPPVRWPSAGLRF